MNRIHSPLTEGSGSCRAARRGRSPEEDAALPGRGPAGTKARKPNAGGAAPPSRRVPRRSNRSAPTTRHPLMPALCQSVHHPPQQRVSRKKSRTPSTPGRRRRPPFVRPTNRPTATPTHGRASRRGIGEQRGRGAPQRRKNRMPPIVLPEIDAAARGRTDRATHEESVLAPRPCCEEVRPPPQSGVLGQPPRGRVRQPIEVEEPPDQCETRKTAPSQ